MPDLPLIAADWPAPPSVKAVTTTRAGGVSAAPYASLNLALHVGDTPAAVAQNRARLRAALRLPAEPAWLTQVHGAAIAQAGTVNAAIEADGSVADRPGLVCAVLTADCLPVFLCNRRGSRVGLLHAGWRGLAGGVIEAGVAAMKDPAAELLVWLGPAIGPVAFEVGEEVRERFLRDDAAAARAFVPGRPGHWQADLYALARLRLARLGVQAVFGGDRCTFSEPERFYSYRRDPVCGRMASLIWLEPKA